MKDMKFITPFPKMTMMGETVVPMPLDMNVSLVNMGGQVHMDPYCEFLQ